MKNKKRSTRIIVVVVIIIIIALLAIFDKSFGQSSLADTNRFKEQRIVLGGSAGPTINEDRFGRNIEGFVSWRWRWIGGELGIGTSSRAVEFGDIYADYMKIGPTFTAEYGIVDLTTNIYLGWENGSMPTETRREKINQCYAGLAQRVMINGQLNPSMSIGFFISVGIEFRPNHDYLGNAQMGIAMRLIPKKKVVGPKGPFTDMF